jgi:hypothetical protein
VPSGSGGAFDGGRWIRDSASVVVPVERLDERVPIGGDTGPLQAANSAIKATKRMTRR